MKIDFKGDNQLNPNDLIFPNEIVSEHTSK